MKFRESTSEDHESLLALYADAFPDEDLMPVVSALLELPDGILSLVAESDSLVVGHILFTRCGIDHRDTSVAMLAPRGVHSVRQRQGIGSALISEGLKRMRSSGVVEVYVLGDPDYYGRSGFRQEDDVKPPYPMPDAWRHAWQSIALDDDAATLSGTLSVPEPWQNPALWS